MSWQELLGFMSGALTTVGFVPQVWRLYKLKSAREISLTFTLLFLIGVGAWFTYGIVEALAPVIFWNAVSLSLMSVMLYAKLKYNR